MYGITTLSKSDKESLRRLSVGANAHLLLAHRCPYDAVIGKKNKLKTLLANVIPLVHNAPSAS